VTIRPRIVFVRCGRDEDYLESLEAVDVEVRAIDPAGDPSAAVSEAEGIVLAGGLDVDPAFYGEVMHPSCAFAGDARDAFEMNVARRCLQEGLPLLAICRGLQVLNVAAGGSLIQDIPSQVPVALPHAVAESLTTVAHGLEVMDDTHVARAVSSGMTTQVNSRHHQAAKVIGDGLVVSAYATDGLVEAIEAPHLPFCVGVQWHPENFWRTGEFLPLFRLFATACRQRTVAQV
jgi:putative glutamine amidotransferase